MPHDEEISPEQLAAAAEIAERLRAAGSLKQLLQSRPIRQIAPGIPGFLMLLPRIICMDGTSLSVQASEYAYCTPRDNDGPWEAVEVGYPSIEMGPTLTEYAEEPDSPTNTVYPYTPIWLVETFIAAHGGIDYAKSFTPEIIARRW